MVQKGLKRNWSKFECMKEILLGIKTPPVLSCLRVCALSPTHSPGCGCCIGCLNCLDYREPAPTGRSPKPLETLEPADQCRTQPRHGPSSHSSNPLFVFIREKPKVSPNVFSLLSCLLKKTEEKHLENSSYVILWICLWNLSCTSSINGH